MAGGVDDSDLPANPWEPGEVGAGEGVVDLEPRAGHKRAFITEMNGKLMFAPLRWPWSARYLASDTARCRGDHPPGEPVPAEDCTCGFYAVADVDTLDGHIGVSDPCTVVIDADLSGRVVEYEQGFRAERQDVMCVHLNKRCVCCRAEASTLGAIDHRHGNVVVPLCTKHARKASWTLEPADLAGKLGCEVAVDLDEPRRRMPRRSAGTMLLLVALMGVFGAVAGGWVMGVMMVVTLVPTMAAMLLLHPHSPMKVTPARLLLLPMAALMLMVPLGLVMAANVGLGTNQLSAKDTARNIKSVTSVVDGGPDVNINERAWKLAAAANAAPGVASTAVAAVDGTTVELAVVLPGVSGPRCMQATITDNGNVTAQELSKGPTGPTVGSLIECLDRAQALDDTQTDKTPTTSTASTTGPTTTGASTDGQ
jgi:hypothetical protein